MMASPQWPKHLVLASVFLVLPTALCQHPGPPGGGPPPGGPPPMGAPPPGADRGGFPGGGPPPGNAPDSRGTVSTMRGGLQLGPPGLWWDDQRFARDLNLRPEQKRRMDAIFEESRANLLKHFEALQQEQNKLSLLTHARVLDEPALLAEIDRVGSARTELEKANTHMLVQIRAQMDPDQIGRLESHR